jgi:hypothetical protein
MATDLHFRQFLDAWHELNMGKVLEGDGGGESPIWEIAIEQRECI